MAIRPHRRFLATLTLSVLVTVQFVTGVFPVPLAPIPSAFASGFSISMTADKTTVNPNDIITYTITITNQDTKLANARIIDPIPTGLTFDHGSSGCYNELQTNEAICPSQPLNVGESRTVTVSFKVNSNVTPCSNITNQSDVWNDNPNPPTGIAPSWSNIITTPVGCQTPNFTITKSVDKTVAAPGDTVTYTITIKNVGSTAQSNIRIGDQVPTGMTYTTTGSTGGCVLNGAVVFCANQTVQPNQTVTVTLKFIVNANATCGSTINNKADLQQNNSSFAWSNQVSTTVDCVNFTVAKSVDKTNAAPGDTITYTIAFTNNGSIAQSNIRLADNVPVGTTYTTAGSTGGCTLNGSTVYCANQTVQPGQTVTVTLKFIVNANATCASTITNKADLQQNNASFAWSNQVSTNVACVSFTINKSVDKTTASPGETVTYTISIQNTGTTAQSNIRIADPVPVGLTFTTNGSTGGCSVSANVVYCANQTVQPNQTVTVTLKFTVNASAVCSSAILNKADIQQNNVSFAWSNQVSTTVNCTPNFTSTKTVDKATAAPGDTITYTITFTNNGTVAQSNIRLADNVPTGTTYTTAGSTGGCTLNGSTVYCANQTVQPGQTVTVTLKFIVNANATCSSVILNKADIQQNNASFAWSNQVSTTVDCINFTSTKSVDKTSAAPGETITYTITFTNNGTTAQSNIRLADNVPTGTTYTTTGSTGGCTLNGSTVYCANQTVQPGQTVTVTLKFIVNANATCSSTILNKADVQQNNASFAWSNQVSTTVNCTPSFTITKSVDKTTAAPGDTVTYTISIQNTGTIAQSNIRIADPVPAGLTYTTVGSTGGCTLNAGVVYCANQTVQPNQTVTVTLKFTVNANATCASTILNKADVQQNSVSFAWSNQVSTTIDCINFTSTKSVDKTTAAPGETITYTITFTNNATTAQSNIRLADNVPAGTTYTTTGSTGGCVLNGATVFCANQTVQPGQTVTVTLKFIVNANTSCGSTILNKADVQQNSVSFAWSNQVSTTVACPTLTVTKTVDKTTAAQGDTVKYTVVVHNTGTVPLTDVWVMDNVPTGMTFTTTGSDARCMLQGNQVKCGNTTIPVGGTDTYIIMMTISANATCNGVLYNTATAVAAGAQTATSNQVGTTVTCGAPDLSVMKIPSKTTVSPGDSISYTIKVFNNGTVVANNVTMNDPVPTGLTFVTAGSTAGCILNGQTIVCGPVSVNPNGAFQMFVLNFTVNAQAPCNGNITNQAEAAINATPVAWSSNTSVAVTCVVVNADLEITKTGPAQPMRGTTILYTIHVVNHGPSNASNVRVTDVVPSVLKQDNSGTVPLVFNAGQSDALCSVSAGTVTCGNVNLNNGASRDFIIAMDLPFEGQCAKAVVNSAAVTSDTTDLTQSNNTSTTAGTINCATTTLDIYKSTTQQTAHVGDLVTYGIAVTNNLGFTVTQNRVIDPVPANMVFVSANDPLCAYYSQTNEVICQTFDLASHASRSFQLTFRVLNTAVCNNYLTNIADVWSHHPGVDPKWSNPVRTQVVCDGATFTITKNDYLTTIAPGERTTYTITVRNTSANNAPNVTITDVLPPNTTFVYANNGGQLSGNTVTWTTSINAGDTQTFTLQLQVNANAPSGFAIHNTACITGGACGDDTTTVSGTPQFTISKTDNRTTAVPGDTVTYVVTVTNTSATNATNVQVIDTLPADLTYVSSSNNGAYASNANTVTWTIAALNAGQSATLTVQTTVKTGTPNGRVLLNSACVTGSTACATDTTTVNVSTPVFSITKTDNRTTAVPNDTLAYVISVSNISTTNATNVQVVDYLPSDVSYVSSGNSGVYSSTANTVTWTLSSLNAGITTTLSLQMKVNSNAPDGRVLLNTVCVNGNPCATDTTIVTNTPPPMGCIDIKKETYNTVGAVLTPVTQFTFTLDGGSQSVLNDSNGNARFNNVPVGSHTVTEAVPSGWTQTNVTPSGGVVSVLTTGSTCVTVTFKNQQSGTTSSQFTITKTDNKTTANEGDTLTYVIVVTNTGTADASNVEVTDPIPGSTTYVSSSDNGQYTGNMARWTFALAKGASKTLTLQVKINSNLSGDTTIYNVATVTGGPSATDTTLVQKSNGNGEVQININDDPDPIDLCYDEDLSYDIVLSNSSNGNASVTVNATLDSDTDYRSSSDGGRERSNNNVEWTGITVNRNSTRTLRLRVSVDSKLRDGDTVRLDVRVSGNGNDSDSEVTRVRNLNCNDIPHTPTNTPDLSIEKSADYNEALPGTVVTYTVTVRNPGNADITNATLKDQYPATYLSIVDPGGATDSSSTLTWNLGTLRKNSTTVVRYRAKLKEGLSMGTTIMNTATVTGGNLTRTATHTIIVPRPPQTGLGGFLHSLTKGNDYVTPSAQAEIAAPQDNGALATFVLITTILTGLGLGGFLGRKFLF